MVVDSTTTHVERPSDPSPYFDDVIRFRCPPILPPAVKTAAARQMVSMSSYIRTAVVERLKNDGIDFGNTEAA